MIGSQYSSSSFELPGHGTRPGVPDAFFDQTAVVLDDGSERCMVRLQRARFVEPVEMSAMLHIDVEGQTVSLTAEAVELDPSAQELRLYFPSLYVLSMDSIAEIPGRLRLTLRWSGEEQEFDTLYRPKRPAAGDE